MMYIILPAFNESKVLGKLIDEIEMVCASFEHKILVINDGSDDTTADIIRTKKARYSLTDIHHAKRQGLGSSMHDGLYHIKPLLKDDDLIVTMDADGTHDPALIPVMRNRCTHDCMLVVASRYQRGGGEIGVPFSRSLCSRIANHLMHRWFPIKHIHDYTSGYRMYCGNLLKKGFEHYGENLITEKGFTCMAEIIIKLGFLSDQFDEIPLVLRYDLKQTKSTMPVGSTIIRYIFLWNNLRLLRSQN
ncbi:MAG: glycosyltransferase [Elusimicrobia bacterium]|nr:glycosyltransferase [Elusimicrobiota bacterium]MBD3412325.1 glycosyltransferase [Elusimicrobiota bacterium]